MIIGFRVLQRRSLRQRRNRYVDRMIHHFLGQNRELREKGGTKAGRNRHVRRVAPARKGNPAYPRMIMPRIEREPLSVEERLEPSAEVHRRRIPRYADIAEITRAVAGRDI